MSDKPELPKEVSRNHFGKISEKVAEIIGNGWMVLFVFLLIVGWVVFGVLHGFTEKWIMVIHTTTAIVTFLLVFLIQNTQNRDAKTLQIKLNELIRSHEHADNSLIDIKKLSDKQLKELEGFYKEVISQKPDNPTE